jgi:hypothetical protein
MNHELHDSIEASGSWGHSELWETRRFCCGCSYVILWTMKRIEKGRLDESSALCSSRKPGQVAGTVPYLNRMPRCILVA